MSILLGGLENKKAITQCKNALKRILHETLQGIIKMETKTRQGQFEVIDSFAIRKSLENGFVVDEQYTVKVEQIGPDQQIFGRDTFELRGHARIWDQLWLEKENEEDVQKVIQYFELIETIKEDGQERLNPLKNLLYKLSFR